MPLGPRTSEYLSREEKAIGRAMGIRFYPIVVERAEGARVWDPDGREYLDFSSQWAVTNLGHGHGRVLEAVRRQLERLVFSSHTTFPNTVAIELAERLAELAPGGFRKKVWFGLTGSDANEFVYKVMPVYSGRRRFLSFLGSYHGQTMGALTLSGHKAMSGLIGFPNAVKAHYPYCYRCPYGRSYPECGLFCMEFLEEQVLDIAVPSEDLAAVVVEPIQSDGGVVVPPPEFLPRLWRICRERGVSLVVDEVKVGFGRTGRMFAVENYGVEPDMIALGKPIASGLPLSACVGRAEIMDSAIALHLFTSSAHPVSCAAALATIEAIMSEGVLERARRLGERMRKRLEEMMGRRRLVGDVRSLGMIAGVELVADESSRKPARREAAGVVYRAWELGLLTTYVGTYSNVLELTPPLTISEEELERGLDILEKAIEDCEKDRVDWSLVRRFAGW